MKYVPLQVPTQADDETSRSSRRGSSTAPVKDVAVDKFYELQLSPSVLARHAAYLASTSSATEVVRPRFNPGTLKYISSAPSRWSWLSSPSPLSPPSCPRLS